jgi:hypothetical protein
MLIRVDPDDLYTQVGRLATAGKLIGDTLTAMVGVWNNLRLGWVGNSATEAQDFNTELNNAFTELFGSSDGSVVGAFQRVADSVGIASINYGEAEQGIEQMFMSLVNALGSSSSTAAAPPPSRDQQQGPVTEIAPAP